MLYLHDVIWVLEITNRDSVAVFEILLIIAVLIGKSHKPTMAKKAI